MFALHRCLPAIALLVVAGSVCQAQMSDTTASVRYFPLAVGNVWEYEGFNDLPHQYEIAIDRHRVLREVAGQPGRFEVETFRWRQFGPHPGQTTTSTTTAVWRFDSTEARGHVGEFASTPCLDAPFDAEVVCGPRTYAVGGGYGQSVDVGSSSLVTTVKTFHYYQQVGNAFEQEDTHFAAGLGETFYRNVAHNGTDMTRRELTLRYALVSGQEYGQPEFPVNSEEGVTSSTPTLTVAPNPVRAVASVHYMLPSTGALRLVLYDVLGREVMQVEEGARSAGTHEAMLDARGLTPGVYVLRIESGETVEARRITVIR